MPSEDIPTLLLTPPASQSEETVSRNRFPSSSEHSLSSTGSLCLYTGDKYRHGAPHDRLRALPQVSKEIDKSSGLYRSFEELKQPIEGLLHSHQIQYADVDLVHRWDPWQGDSLGILTVLIRAKRNDQWDESLAKIVDVVCDHGHIDWAVEILDRRANQHFFPPKLTTTLSSAWESLRIDVLDILGRGPQWGTLTLLNQGQTTEDSKPTVVIGLMPEADRWWQSLVLRRTKGLIQSSGNFLVTFIRSGLLFYDRGHLAPPQTTLSPTEALSKVSLGASIGIGRSGTGTLGGFLRLKDPKSQREYAMGFTCHHVIGNREQGTPASKYESDYFLACGLRNSRFQ